MSAPIFCFRFALLLRTLVTLISQALEVFGVLFHVPFREGIFLGRTRIFLRNEDFKLTGHRDFRIAEDIF